MKRFVIFINGGDDAYSGAMKDLKPNPVSATLMRIGDAPTKATED